MGTQLEEMKKNFARIDEHCTQMRAALVRKGQARISIVSPINIQGHP
jgi:hypothetical protein